MSGIEIWSLTRALGENLSRFGAIITIESKDQRRALRVDDSEYYFDQLILNFDDVSAETGRKTPPQLSDISKALEFARSHSDADLLVHCHAGVSRSPAIAISIMADRLGVGMEPDAVQQVIDRTTPPIEPNMLVIHLADQFLCRDGRLVGAVQAVFGGATRGVEGDT